MTYSNWIARNHETVPESLASSENARREAIGRRNDQDGLNPGEDIQDEYGYSPSTGAVGLRSCGAGPWRVFNIYYPMYGKADQVTDWVSVGFSKPLGKRGSRRFEAI